ncbi:Abi-alpha family protein [Marmoricola sp. RAF53]|uniref:Abi-alpha family protein n=1 Tax=Marmoricola sp. RAF53 TaxID=3233059 RepID=UPI003F98E44F
MSSRLDPLRLWGTTVGVVRHVGGAVTGAVGDAVGEVVGSFVEGLAEGSADRKQEQVVTPDAAPGTGLDVKMQALLSRALEQSTASGQDELFHRILDQLVPDEARIIGALSDGTPSPLVSVHALTRAGLLGEALIENACLVGRTANVALPRLTPTYVGHLIALGLAEVGPEDDGLKDEYQILMAETDVLAALRTGSRGPVPARVEKRTLRLTALGHALWEAST